jgi:hypothetical protein
MLIEFMREQVLEGFIEMKKTPTKQNVADMLTKHIVSKAFAITAMHLLGEMGIDLDPNMNNNNLIYEQEYQFHQPLAGVLYILSQK